MTPPERTSRDQADQIREVVLEVVSQVAHEVNCKITKVNPVHASPKHQPNTPSTTPPVVNVANLSSSKLTPNTLSLLKKGLTFVPSPYPNRTRQTRPSQKDVDKDLRNLKEKYIDKYTGKIPTRAERLLKCSLTAIKFDLERLTIDSSKPNLTYGERHALRSLVKNRGLIISKADKGDTTVIMATPQYLELAYKHLNDEKTYQQLDRDPTQEIAERFNRYLESSLQDRTITKEEFNKLVLPDKVETQTMYFIPKIHK